MDAIIRMRGPCNCYCFVMSEVNIGRYVVLNYVVLLDSDSNRIMK